MTRNPPRGAAPICSLFLCALAGCGQCDDFAEPSSRAGSASLSTLAPIMATRDMPCRDVAVAFDPPMRALPARARPTHLAAAK
jgi:hypothetical protein